MIENWKYGQVFKDVFELSAPTLIGLAVTVTIGILIFLLSQKVKYGKEVQILLGFGILGGISGVIAGASNEPIVGALVTGILGIVTAILSYGYSKNENSYITQILPTVLLVLLINCLIGISAGQNWRKKWDAYEVKLIDYRADYDDIFVPVNKEMRLKLFDKCIEKYKDYDQILEKCTYDKLFKT